MSETPLKKSVSFDASVTDKPGGSPNKRPTKKKTRLKRKEKHRIEREASAKFKGLTDGLDGYYFDCTTRKQTDQYIETVEKIGTYVGKEFEHGADIKRVVDNLRKPDLGTIADPAPGANRYEIRKWEKKVDEHIKRENCLDRNIAKLYNLVWGQCTQAMQAEMKTYDNWDTISQQQDAIGAIVTIKNIVYNFEAQQKRTVGLLRGYKRLFTMYQGKTQSVPDYLDHFMNNVKVIEESGGILGGEPKLIADCLEAKAEELGVPQQLLTQLQIQQAVAEAREAFLATCLLEFSDRNRFGTLLEDLENEYTSGYDKYPTTITQAYNRLLRYKRDPKLLSKMLTPTQEALAFAQSPEKGGPRKKKEGGGKSKFPEKAGTVHCFDCGADGEKRNTCKVCKANEKKGTNAHIIGELDEEDAWNESLYADDALVNFNDLHEVIQSHSDDSDDDDAFTFMQLGAFNEYNTDSDEDTNVPQDGHVYAQWTREDRNVSTFLTTRRDGPSWKLVNRRVTINSDTKEVIEDITIDENTDEDMLHRKLPKDVNSIKTILHYDKPYEVVLNQRFQHNAREDHILLDTGSTIDIFCNKDLLRNIRRVKRCMRISCNAGVVKCYHKGTLPGYGEVWFSPHAIANILSFSKVESKFEIEWCGQSKAFKVHTRSKIQKFKLRNGLYILDCSKALTLVNTVKDNKEHYTRRAYLRALKARKLQNIMGYPSTATLVKALDNNLIPNCDVTREDVMIAEDILGPNAGSLQGKTVERQGDPVEIKIIPVPKSILDKYKRVTVCVDVMRVNTIPFLMSIARSSNPTLQKSF